MKNVSKSKVNLRSYHGNHPGYDKNNPVCYFNPRFKRANVFKLSGNDFNYIFRKLVNDPDSLIEPKPTTIEMLKRLADLMVDQASIDNDNSIIPPGYTYWGQFIDHDLTGASSPNLELEITKDDFDPADPDTVVGSFENLRTPFFDLDSVYGDKDGPWGAMADFYGFEGDPIKLKIGVNEGVGVPGIGDTPDPGLDDDPQNPNRDLPRINGSSNNGEIPTLALIGDLRNDENLAVAQFHLAWLKFHNAVVDVLRVKESAPKETSSKAVNEGLFAQARKEVVFTYQWLVVNDFLHQIIGEDRVEHILKATEHQNLFHLFKDYSPGKPFMPLEFSVAAYRFGHTMVRNEYDYNLNFGFGGNFQDRAPFNLLFSFTGKGAEAAKKGIIQPPVPSFNNTLTFNWIIQWDRFFDTQNQPPIPGFPPRFSRKIDTLIGIHLTDPGMQNEDFLLLDAETQSNVEVPFDQFNQIMKHLARRNLLRGYLLSLPTAQAILNFLSEYDISICPDGQTYTPLTEQELLTNVSVQDQAIFIQGDFLDRTPLWFYVLKEAEIRENGNRLGCLGSWIVGMTFLSLLREDPESYLNKGWDPAGGIVTQERGMPLAGIMDVLRFAKVAPEVLA